MLQRVLRPKKESEHVVEKRFFCFRNKKKSHNENRPTHLPEYHFYLLILYLDDRLIYKAVRVKVTVKETVSNLQAKIVPTIGLEQENELTTTNIFIRVCSFLIFFLNK